MNTKGPLVRSISFLWLLTGCVEPYYPPPGAGQGGQLVIDGFINASNKSATVRLSRAISLTDAIPVPAESNATVTIVSSSGVEYQLTESEDENKAGVYSVDGMLMDPADMYTLHVVTKSGGSYSSNAIELLDSPLLDSISWRPEPTGVRFYVSSHDPDNKTRYYRWTFVETFQYNAPVISYFKNVDGLPVPRGSGDYVYYCWSSYNSTNIMVNSTNQLASDVVSMFPIYFIPKGDRKLSFRYRMVLQQRAISQDEFEFWQLMRKTTETMGGLFDPMPSQVIGNIHNDNDPKDYVLGYFSGGYVDEATKYIGHLELPGDLNINEPYDFDCSGRRLFLHELDKLEPNEMYYNTFGFPYIEGYIVGPKICADCRYMFNGTNVMPNDWPIL